MIGKKPINDLHMVSQWLIGAFGCMVWNQRKFLDFMITMETKKRCLHPSREIMSETLLVMLHSHCFSCIA